MRRRNLLTATAATAAAWSALPLAAQTAPYPHRPIKVVVPYAAGGVTDVGARLLLEKMTPLLGQPLVVENRPGKGGQTGTAFAVGLPDDGYNLLFTSSGTLSFAAVTTPKLPYNPVRDFQPISLVSTYGLVAVVPYDLPAQTFADFITYVKRNPGRVNYSTPGIGSGTQFATELLKDMAGIQMTHIPYNGGAPALQAVASGAVQLTLDGQIKAMVDAKLVRPIAVTQTRRDPRYPDVPTMSEAGLAGYNLEAWLALLGPRSMPRALVQRLNAAATAALKDPQLQKQYAELGLFAEGGPSERVTEKIERDVADYQKIAARAKLTFE
jgi:tripartite-type tricarboxylate transporter receptor subunit TctC